ncbi:CheR family methyltransferase [Paracoccus sediminicola]|uniref:CheR family methyltransferase n=1 Tax=Paracoccus sediminicola TaxID=3017783 RepID=UPI0022F0D04F|nr:CheR family methyltransferase [Paracoccus sediminicola]WBU58170.1 chemotaxis protein [Paracoccus sediminicola]
MNHPAFSSVSWSMNDQEFEQLRKTIYAYSGIVIGPEKRSMIRARLQKRLATLKLTSMAEYLRLVGGVAGSAEREHFISSLTTNVTSFFREKHHFSMLTDRILPGVTPAQPQGAKTLIWSAGCSSGQEPYSIALSILDRRPELAERTRILASDIDSCILSKARSGRYRRSDLTAVPPEMQARYFRPVHEPAASEEIELAAPVRSMVEFRQVNLNSAWPVAQGFSVIFCRNVAIYFDQDTQRSLWLKFHASLRPGGWLLIGHSERVPAEMHHLLRPSGITAYQKPN